MLGATGANNTQSFVVVAKRRASGWGAVMADFGCPWRLQVSCPWARHVGSDRVGTLGAPHQRMYGRGSLTLFHVRGVPIRAHWSLLLIVPYLAVILSVQFAAVARIAGVEHIHLVLPPLIWGAILALGLFASVALHEGAHCLVAIRFGGRVRAITLMLLGGVSQITRIPRRPRYEGLMALAGPATSLALGAVLLGLYRIVPGPADLNMGLFYLGSMNIMLGAFNLIPAFPMDGGRILRAALAGPLGTSRATQVAAGVGRGAAVVMGLAGLWTGNFLLLLIAIFVYFGAGAEALGERMHEALAGVRIADLVPLIRRPPAMISSDAPLAEVLQRMHDSGRLDLVVTDRAGAPVTVIQAGDLANIAAEHRAQLRVGDIAGRFGARQISVPWDANAADVLEQAAEQGMPYIIVTDPAMTSPQSLIGLVSAADIQNMITLRLVETRRRPPSTGAITQRPQPQAH